MTTDNDQNGADDFSEIDATLKELGIELDDTGNPSSASGAGDEETQKKTRHAFATLKRKYKEEREAREKGDADMEALKNENTNTDTSTKPPTSGGSKASQLMASLKMKAMQELGLSEVTTTDELELVNTHASALYQDLLRQQKDMESAKGKADGFVSNALEQYNLTTEDSGEVIKRIKSMSPLDQVDGGKVRSVVAGYLGEKLLSGDTVSPASPVIFISTNTVLSTNNLRIFVPDIVISPAESNNDPILPLNI